MEPDEQEDSVDHLVQSIGQEEVPSVTKSFFPLVLVIKPYKAVTTITNVVEMIIVSFITFRTFLLSVRKPDAFLAKKKQIRKHMIDSSDYCAINRKV